MHHVYKMIHKEDGKKYPLLQQGFSFGNFEDWLEDRYDKGFPDKPAQNYIYTIWDCGKDRNDPKTLNYFYLDLDNMNLNDSTKFLHVIAGYLGVDVDEIGAVCSGRGLQIYLKLDERVNTEDYVTKYRKIFKAVCDNVHSHCIEHGLKYDKDSIYDIKRLLRVPNTINFNPDKEPEYAEARVINPYIGTIDRSRLEELAGSAGREELYIPSDSTVSGSQQFKDKKCIEFLWNNRPRKGRIHKILLRLISHEIRLGKSYEEVLEKVRLLADRFTLDMGHVDQVVKDLWRRVDNDFSYDFGCKDEVLSSACDLTCKLHPNNKKVSIKKTEGTRMEDCKKIANELVQKYSGIRYTRNSDNIFKELVFVFNGKFYEEIAPIKLVDDIWEVTKWAESKIKGMLPDILREISTLQTFSSSLSSSDLNSDPRYLNVSNGVLCLETMELVDHSPEFRLFYCLTTEYCPTKKKHPLFNNFLKKVTNGDELKKKLLLQILATPLVPHQIEKMFWIYGEAATGKSTYVSIMRYLYGAANTSSLSLGQINGKYNLSYMSNKLLNIASEGSAGEKQPTKIKQILSGEPILVERKFKDPQDIIINTKLVFVFNERPTFNEKTSAISRRLIQIIFDEKIIQDDSSRILDYGKHIVTEESSAILNLVLKEYQELVANNFAFTETVQTKESNMEIQKAGDSVFSFFDEYFETSTDPEEMVPTVWLFETYDKFCHNNRILNKYTQHSFNLRIAQMTKLTKKRDRVLWNFQKVRSICWVGLSVKDKETLKEECPGSF